jgi:hypothetical protein
VNDGERKPGLEKLPVQEQASDAPVACRHVDGLKFLLQGIAMKIDRLQVMLEASPFIPFALVLPNGEKLRVPHADFAWIHPGKRSVVVALKGDVVRIVNWQMVAAIETKAAAV